MPKSPREGLPSSPSITLTLTLRQTRFCSVPRSACLKTFALSYSSLPKQHLGTQEIENYSICPSLCCFSSRESQAGNTLSQIVLCLGMQPDTKVILFLKFYINGSMSCCCFQVIFFPLRYHFCDTHPKFTKYLQFFLVFSSMVY